MKISVIIPTYKPQNYLWECLDSLVGQTFPKEEFEVILVLNGCTEPYKTNIEQYIIDKMHGMNINFIHTEVGGVSNARNIALNHVQGEFITFIDDDDFVSPRYLELLYENADSNTISLCYPFAFNDGDISKSVPYPMMKVYDEMHDRKDIVISSKVRKFFSGPCMKLIPMSYIQGRQFDVRFSNGEDSLFMFLISDRFKNIRFAQRDAIYYRRYRVGSAVTSRRKKSVVLKTGLLQIFVYFKYFLKCPFRYNWSFFITRILAASKQTISNCF